MRKISDVPYCESGNPAHVLVIYLPDTEEFSVFIHFHGGGFQNGTKDEGKSCFPYMTENGIAVVCPSYRLYPDAKFPQFIEDGATAVAWAMKNMPAYGKCKKFFIGGTSAGGHLSMLLCFDKRYLAPHGISPMDISGFIHSAGQPTTHFNVLKERGLDTGRVIVDEAAPMYYIGTESELPPMLFFVSDDDLPGRYEQTVLMVKTLELFGHGSDKVSLNVMHDVHCGYVHDINTENGKAYTNAVIDFVNKN